MLETLRVIIAFILGIALPLVLQRWDLRRLTDAQRRGAWNAASWGAALYAFGPFSMIGWLWVTRRAQGRWRGESTAAALGKNVALLLTGLGAALVVILGIIAVDALIGLAAGESFF